MKGQWSSIIQYAPEPQMGEFLLPAVTLAVLDEGQLSELVLHKGRPHQLHTGQKKVSAYSSSEQTSCICVCVCVCTSMVTVCVSVGTHSKASSAQQPPHRLTDTQDGMKRLWVSSGNSRQTSTRVSRGSQPLREYTSNHRRTCGETRTNTVFYLFYSFTSVTREFM